MAKNIPREQKPDMYEAILSLRDLGECQDFFKDICAATELRAMEQRYEVAEMLSEGKVYTEIMQKTNASSATISRVHNMMENGTGVFPQVLERNAGKEEV